MSNYRIFDFSTTTYATNRLTTYAYYIDSPKQFQISP